MGRTVEMKCGEILENSLLKTDYYRIRFYAPEIAAKALPGQFVIKIIFSIYEHN